MRASGIRPGFPGLSRSSGQVAHVLRTRSPLSPGPKSWFSLDLHVLGAPPAFVLSQDQTLHQDLDRTAGYPRDWSSIGELLRNLTEVEEQLNELTEPPFRHRCKCNGVGSNGFTGFWRSLFCFQEASSRHTSGRHVLASRTGSRRPRKSTRIASVGVNRPCRSGPVRATPASGAVGKTTETARGSQTPAAGRAKTLVRCRYGSLTTPSTSIWFEYVGADMSQPSVVATPVTVTT